ncbi:signal peptidase II [Boudabousia marimammalium]|uniref:Lipoprotein signal peptidase n=1 Tax=Boudabousia marimammalium TaxID=156892 RepID=A0A1Q5PP04_9ACTO|nr:signal peptidase II [Boudabousia marimammalium]OKL49236.1 signal peptidase II [Boudabousia marimammalium]
MTKSALTKPLFWLIFILGVFLDQVTKLWAIRSLSKGQTIHLIGDFLALRLIRNPGAAFSLGEETTWIFTVISVVVIIALVTAVRSMQHRIWWISISVLLAGAVGNLIDRLFQSPGFGRGHVIDMISYNGWFIGNIADIYIVLAVAAIALLLIRGIPSGNPAISAVTGSPSETTTETDTRD